MTPNLHIARGDDFESPKLSARLPSPLSGIASAEWSNFVNALVTQRLGDVSASNGLGWFEMRPRRLADLGIMSNLRRVSNKVNRQVYEGDFVLPLTMRKFLENPVIQYNTLVKSVIDHFDTHVNELKLPDDVSRSGALAILHRAGPGGLKTWSTGKRFDDTISLFNRSNGIF